MEVLELHRKRDEEEVKKFKEAGRKKVFSTYQRTH
jgi:hypothetical protein